MSNRHTVLRLSFSAVIAIVGLSISMLSYAQESSSSATSDSSSSAASIDTSAQSLVIDQGIEGQTDFATVGNWTLKMPDYTDQIGNDRKSVMSKVLTGNHTLFVKMPEGMNVTVTLLRNGNIETVTKRPQINFQINPNDQMGILLMYKLVNIGKVAVLSDPPGLDFTIHGPNGSKFTGMTPTDYNVAPAGLYSVTYVSPVDCPRLPVKSLQLEAKSRIGFNVTLQCKGADELRNNPRSRSSSSISAVSKASSSQAAVESSSSAAASSSSEVSVAAPAHGTVTQPGTMIDVPPNSWFAPFIFKAAQRGILTGYKDDQGNATGMFGPSNLITRAELSVIAHRLGGLSEQQFAHIKTANTGALNYWFTPMWTSAEERGWVIYQDPLTDPLGFASRSEVVITFLQAMDIPLEWQKGDLFTDVTPRTRYAAAIETAAHMGMVEGRKDAGGNPLRLFVPEDPINRAEIAKIITKIFGD